MWCSDCQQEVPGVPHALTGRTVCPRCQQPADKATRQGVRICDDGLALDDPMAAALAAAPPRIDQWSADLRVRSLKGVLRRTAPSDAISIRTTPSRRRFDPPQQLFDAVPITPAPLLGRPAEAKPAAPSRRGNGPQILAWLIVMAGSIALGAGIALLGWSLNSGQMEQWNEAIGLTLGGQGTLILGLVLVVSRLWRNSRYSSAKLQEVHAQLGELQHTADALTAMRTSSAPAFYAELVRGASPHMLLANLKGQLDQLATRLGNGL